MDKQTTLTNIREKYANILAGYRAEENRICEKILLRERQLQRLEHSRKKLSESHPKWTELLLQPIIRKIQLKLPDWICEDDAFSPRGLGARVSVFFIRKDAPPGQDKYLARNSIYITFLPGNLYTGELLYETGETTTAYQMGTLGEINGFNQVTKPVDSIEELTEFLTKQINSHGN